MNVVVAFLGMMLGVGNWEMINDPFIRSYLLVCSTQACQA
jgi:hypothetical protein